MGRNCGFELRLVSAVYDNNQCSIAKEEQEEQLTVLFNRKINNCDIRQLQASTTISLASKEFEEKMKSIIGLESPLVSLPLTTSPHSTVTYGNYRGLSMKRSLQRFLQRRKDRIQSAAPYDFRI